MPRDGSNIYHRPPGTDGIPDTTIESAKYNAFVADVEQDLNTPRPIVAGGTGASSARDAMIALGGEIASQIVTNYDFDPIIPGSFTSAPGATSAPEPSHNFAGICYGTGSGIFLEAWSVDATTPIKYVRTNSGGTWGAWKQLPGTVADTDARYVNVAGDTMTGVLTIASGVTSQIMLAPTSGATRNTTIYQSANVFGVGAAGIGTYLSIDLATGNATFNASLTVANGMFVTNGTLAVQNGGITATGAINVGGNINTSATITATGNINSSTTITATGNISTSADFSTSNGGAVLRRPTGGVQLTLIDTTAALNKYIRNSNGTLEFVNNANTVVISYLTDAGYFGAVGHQCRAGTAAAGFGANTFGINYAAGPIQMWIDSSNFGNITVTSDYRIKKDVIDLPTMWDTVKALRPIKYTQAAFTPPAQLEANAKARSDHATSVEAAKVKGERLPAALEVPPEPMFREDNIERWGFIAHELQETLIPTASTGVKDSPDHVQSPNPFTVIAALTKALQEAMARIEALEAA